MFGLYKVVEGIIMSNSDNAHSMKRTEGLSIEQLINAFNWAKIEGRDSVSEEDTFCEHIRKQISDS